jgi:hypothetical protein
MGLRCSKAHSKDIRPSNDLKGIKPSTLKDLMTRENFKDGKLVIGGECLTTTEPCEHPDCIYIAPDLKITALGTLDAIKINRALKTGVYAEYSEEGLKTADLMHHFLI